MGKLGASSLHVTLAGVLAVLALSGLGAAYGLTDPVDTPPTVTKVYHSAFDTPIPIPDHDGSGINFERISNTIHVPDRGTLVSVTMNLTANHQCHGDLEGTLTAAGPPQDINIDDKNENCSLSEGVDTIFHYTHTSTSKDGGTLNFPDSISIQRDWILQLYDTQRDETGELDSWLLELEYTCPAGQVISDNTCVEQCPAGQGLVGGVCAERTFTYVGIRDYNLHSWTLHDHILECDDLKELAILYAEGTLSPDSISCRQFDSSGEEVTYDTPYQIDFHANSRTGDVNARATPRIFDTNHEFEYDYDSGKLRIRSDIPPLQHIEDHTIEYAIRVYQDGKFIATNTAHFTVSSDPIAPAPTVISSYHNIHDPPLKIPKPAGDIIYDRINVTDTGTIHGVGLGAALSTGNPEHISLGFSTPGTPSEGFVLHDLGLCAESPEPCIVTASHLEPLFDRYRGLSVDRVWTMAVQNPFDDLVDTYSGWSLHLEHDCPAGQVVDGNTCVDVCSDPEDVVDNGVCVDACSDSEHNIAPDRTCRENVLTHVALKDHRVYDWDRSDIVLECNDLKGLVDIYAEGVINDDEQIGCHGDSSDAEYLLRFVAKDPGTLNFSASVTVDGEYKIAYGPANGNNRLLIESKLPDGAAQYSGQIQYAVQVIRNGSVAATSSPSLITLDTGARAPSDPQEPLRVSYHAVPRYGTAIPDNDTTGITSTITVPVSGLLVGAEVGYTAAHPSPGELAGSINASDKSHLLDALASSGAVSITSAESSFSPVDMSGGDWTFHIYDGTAGNEGTFEGWSLHLEYCADGQFAHGDTCVAKCPANTVRSGDTCEDRVFTYAGIRDYDLHSWDLSEHVLSCDDLKGLAILYAEGVIPADQISCRQFESEDEIAYDTTYQIDFHANDRRGDVNALAEPRTISDKFTFEYDYESAVLNVTSAVPDGSTLEDHTIPYAIRVYHDGKFVATNTANFTISADAIRPTPTVISSYHSLHDPPLPIERGSNHLRDSLTVTDTETLHGVGLGTVLSSEHLQYVAFGFYRSDGTPSESFDHGDHNLCAPSELCVMTASHIDPLFDRYRGLSAGDTWVVTVQNTRHDRVGTYGGWSLHLEHECPAGKVVDGNSCVDVCSDPEDVIDNGVCVAACSDDDHVSSGGVCREKILTHVALDDYRVYGWDLSDIVLTCDDLKGMVTIYAEGMISGDQIGCAGTESDAEYQLNFRTFGDVPEEHHVRYGLGQLLIEPNLNGTAQYSGQTEYVVGVSRNGSTVATSSPSLITLDTGTAGLLSDPQQPLLASYHYSAPGYGTPIPENTDGITDTIAVSLSKPLVGVEVGYVAEHPETIELAGTIIRGSDTPYELNDLESSGAASITRAASLVSPGDVTDGDWTFNIGDETEGNEGTFAGWSLHLEYCADEQFVHGDTCVEFCPVHTAPVNGICEDQIFTYAGIRDYDLHSWDLSEFVLTCDDLKGLAILYAEGAISPDDIACRQFESGGGEIEYDVPYQIDFHANDVASDVNAQAAPRTVPEKFTFAYDYESAELRVTSALPPDTELEVETIPYTIRVYYDGKFLATNTADFTVSAREILPSPTIISSYHVIEDEPSVIRQGLLNRDLFHIEVTDTGSLRGVGFGATFSHDTPTDVALDFSSISVATFHHFVPDTSELCDSSPELCVATVSHTDTRYDDNHGRTIKQTWSLGVRNLVTDNLGTYNGWSMHLEHTCPSGQVVDGNSCVAQCPAGKTAVNGVCIIPGELAITAPADITVEATAQDTPSGEVELGVPVASGGQGPRNITNNAPDTYPLGDTTVTWTATDGSGNTATDTQTVTLQDTTPPVFSGIPANITVVASNAAGARLVFDTPTATDAVSGTVNVSSTHFSDDTFPIGITNVTFTATDGSDNTATTLFTITVTPDTTPPEITAPADVTVEATALNTPESDVDLGTPTVSDESGTITTSNDAPITTYPLGDTTVTWTATDGSGNTATDTQTVTIRDTTPPVFSPLFDIVAAATSPEGAQVSFTHPTATDAVYGDVPVMLSHNSGDTFGIGITTVTLTATDDSENTATASFTIAVAADTTPPEITAPADVTVEATALNTPASDVDLGTPTASDDTGGVRTSNNATGTYPLGDTVIEWTATDDYGNNATDTQTVTLQDTTPPVFSDVPEDITAEAESDVGATVAFTPPTANDAIHGTVNVTSSHNSGDTFEIGTTTVTFTATDDSENTATASFDITVAGDITAPTITAPADITVNATALNTPASNVTLGTPTASDDSGSVETSNNAPTTTYPLGDTIVTWTATDPTGNTANDTQTVTLQDVVPPVFSGIPANITVTASNSAGAPVSFTAPTATDAIYGTIQVSSSHTSGATYPVGTTTVTFTATDGSGNTATASFDITVSTDADAPTITAPPDVTIEATALNTPVSEVSLGRPTISDASGVVTYSNDAPTTTYPLGDTIITWTATDGSGNTATDTQTVTLQDTVKPVFSGIPDDIEKEATSSAGVTVEFVPPTADDAIHGTTEVSSSHDSGDLFPVGTTTVVFSATDASDNTAEASFDIVVTPDTTPPTITAPADVTAEATALNTPASEVVLGDATISDNSGNVEASNDAPTTYPLGATTVTWTATDGSGNTATDTQTVTLQDTVLPVISGVPDDITRTATSSAGAQVPFALPTATDAIHGTVQVTSSHNSGDTFAIGTTTVTFTATDGSGNTATASFDITVEEDTEDPTITAPADITVEATALNTPASEVQLGDATASDNSGVSPTITNNASTTTYPLGDTVITWTATDGSGNTATDTQTVTLQDTAEPVISGVPDDITRTATSLVGAQVTFALPTATDAIHGTVQVTSSHASGDTFEIGTTTVTFTATDGSGNEATASFAVTVEADTEDPEITAPADVTVEATALNTPASEVTLGTPTASDNSGVVDTSNDAPTTYPLGATVITWTATDGSDNTATDTQTVTLQDTTLPVFSDIPDDIEVPTYTNAGVAVEFTPPTATDAIHGTIQVTSSHASGDTFDIGTTTVTFTATDDSDNTATASFDITVTPDTTPPTITAPADVTVEATALNTPASNITLGTPTASDNSGSVTTSNDAPDTYPVGSTVITWTATDASGNSATDTQTVTIQDTVPPVFSNIPDDITVTASTDAGTRVSFDAPTATDAIYGTIQVTSSHSSGATFAVGTTTVTFTATDGSNNTATASLDITVDTDDDAPTITAPADVTIEATALNTPASEVSLGRPTVSDSSGVVTFSNDAPATYPLGSTIVTWTAADGSGNTATDTQNVTLQDTTPPVFSDIPDDITIQTFDNEGKAVEFVPPTANDAIYGAVNVTSSHASGDTFEIGITTVTFTATDGSDNTATASLVITVAADITAPTITAPADITLDATALNTPASEITLGTPVASDNSGSVTTSNDAPDTYPVGSTVITWTATDPTGNSATDTQTVTIRDTDPPVFSGMPENVTVTATSSAGAQVMFELPTATDAIYGTVDVSASHASGATFAIGTTTVTFTATDGSNNIATASFDITIEEDTENPIITAPADITVEATALNTPASEVTLGTPTASDNSGSVSTSNNATDTYPLGATIITWTATDGSGNTATDTQTVTIQDTTAPVFSDIPDDITVQTFDNEGKAVEFVPPTANDAIHGTVQVTSSHASGDTFAVGITTVTFTATDGSNNTATASLVITVAADITAPTITAPADITIDATALNTPASEVTLGTPTASDNSGSVTTSNDAPDTYPVGSTVITWTATDPTGNSATDTQTVTIQDTDPPVFSGIPDDITVTASTDAGTQVTFDAPTATDAIYGTIQVTSSHTSGDTFAAGTTTVTFTAVDGSGNTATASFVITVEADDSAPTITAPADITREATVLNTPASEIELGTPTISDSSGVVIFSNDAPDTYPIGTTTVTWTATDGSNNEATDTQTVTMQDTVPPVFSGIPGDIAVEASDGTGAAVTFTTPTATDAIYGTVSVSASHTSGATYPVGTTTVTFTATDGAGNTATASFDITVEYDRPLDSEPPVLAGVPADINIIAESAAGATITIEPPTATDNTDGAVAVSSTHASPHLFPIGIHTVTFTATDSSGNTAAASITVTVLPMLSEDGVGSGTLAVYSHPPVPTTLCLGPMITEAGPNGSLADNYHNLHAALESQDAHMFRLTPTYADETEDGDGSGDPALPASPVSVRLVNHPDTGERFQYHGSPAKLDDSHCFEILAAHTYHDGAFEDRDKNTFEHAVYLFGTETADSEGEYSIAGRFGMSHIIKSALETDYDGSFSVFQDGGSGGTAKAVVDLSGFVTINGEPAGSDAYYAVESHTGVSASVDGSVLTAVFDAGSAEKYVTISTRVLAGGTEYRDEEQYEFTTLSLPYGSTHVIRAAPGETAAAASLDTYPDFACSSAAADAAQTGTTYAGTFSGTTTVSCTDGTSRYSFDVVVEVLPYFDPRVPAVSTSGTGNDITYSFDVGVTAPSGQDTLHVCVASVGELVRSDDTYTGPLSEDVEINCRLHAGGVVDRISFTIPASAGSSGASGQETGPSGASGAGTSGPEKAAASSSEGDEPTGAPGTELSPRQQDLVDRIERLKERLAAAQAELAATPDHLEKRIEKIKERIETMSNRIVVLQERLDGLN